MSRGRWATKIATIFYPVAAKSHEPWSIIVARDEISFSRDDICPISSRGIVENDNFYDNFVPFLSPHRQKFRHGPKLSCWGLSPISLNRAILCRQEPCSHSDDSSRDELIVRGSYADNAIPAISCEKQFEASPSPRQCRARLWKP